MMENENKSFGYGTENQQFGTPQGDQSFGNTQNFGTTQNDQSFGAAQNDQQFGGQQFGADQSFGNAQSFGAAQNDQQFGGQQFGADQSFGNAQSFGTAQNDQQFGGQQFGADQSFGNTQSFGADQSFGTAQNDQQFGGQTYGQPNQQFGYSSNMGYDMESAPLNAKGQPMKNNFGMKMTFSILEILTCCGCNVLTMVLGIIGCVFTTKANNSYKEGRWEDFKSQAKAATISLWIGFVLFIIGTILAIVMWTAGGLSDAFWEGYNEGYNGVTSSYSSDDDIDDEDDEIDVDDDSDDEIDADDDSDDEDEGVVVEFIDDRENDEDSDSNDSHDSDYGTADNATLAGDVYVYVEDECISVPLEYEELEEMGYYLSSSNSSEIIESGDFGLFSITNSSGERVMWVWLYNYDSSDAYANECTVIGIDVDTLCENLDEYSTSEGLGFYNTREDFLNTYGTPDEESGDEGYEVMGWYLGDGQDPVWQVMEVTFMDGELYDIDIDYGY